MSDLISRQAAIDAIQERMDSFRHADCEWAMNAYNGACECAGAIKSLPSAKPEKVCIANVTLSEKTLKELVEKAKAEMAQSILTVIEPEQRWIPCSDRLPMEEDYIGCDECIDGAVWYFTDKGAMGLGYYYESTKAWSTTDDRSPYGEVNAWMPLPEPYQEEGK